MRVLRPALAAATAVLMLGVALAVPGQAAAPTGIPDGPVASLSPRDRGALTGDGDAAPPLAGTVIVIDPGHQLGNHNFPEEINRLVPAGGFKKACNTTGTATAGGYPEATFNFRVASLLRARLEKAGARVVMTRSTNSEDHWGPCIDARGRAGNKIPADLKISIHGDGNIGGGPGFHVIAPTDRRPWTHDIHRSSTTLARTVRRTLHRGAGLPYAAYTAGGDGLDFRSDLGTLNLSDVPTILVELGNMRDDADADRMTSPRGRRAYAAALARGVERYLGA